MKVQGLYRIKGDSRYFKTKYGTPNPLIVLDKKLDYHYSYTPASFLYLGRGWLRVFRLVMPAHSTVI